MKDARAGFKTQLLDPSILFENLTIIVSEVCWLKCYLTNLTQCICNGTNYQLQNPTSFLNLETSPFYYLINDITKLSSIMELILFADDTTIFMSGSDLDKLVECVNSELEKNYSPV